MGNLQGFSYLVIYIYIYIYIFNPTTDLVAFEVSGRLTLTYRPSLPPGISWYSFLETELTPGHMELSDALGKIPSNRGSIPGPSD
jgi:hypothetical protein